jgi:cobalamin biosynthesis Co2+ chelatase CbiK
MDIENLTKNDVIVFWGGTYEASKNNSQKGLRQLVDYIKKNKHTNIVLMCVPHRHDLAYYWSCVNKVVENFNRKLLKFMKPFGHIKVIKVQYIRNILPDMDCT